MKREIIVEVTLILSGCGGGGSDDGSGKGDTTNNITCFNAQPVQIVTLPTGTVPNIEGDGEITSETDNQDGTSTYTISGCNFTITGDTNINVTDSNNQEF